MKKNSKDKPQQKGPDFAGFMAKIQEQLDILEKKMDAFVGQFLPRPVEPKEQPKPAQPVDRPHPAPEAKQGHPHRERALYKAVCADCHQDCEIPFNPSGDRPVYCKACFSKRKSGRKGKASVDHKQAPVHREETVASSTPATPHRHVVVTKKGVGKVTVSDIIRPSTPASPSHSPSKPKESPRRMREHFPKRKNDRRGPRPEK